MTNAFNKRQLLKNLAFGAIIGAIPNLAHAASAKGNSDTANSLNVEVAGVVVPIASGRRLVNYCFMRLIVTAADFKSAEIMRSNTGLVKDAISRATAIRPVPMQNPPNYFNKGAFVQQIFPVVANALIGVKIKKITVIDPQLMNK